MKDDSYGFLCAFLLGIAHMCMFVGNDTGSFIVESVLHYVHEREPARMQANAGYYGLAIVNLFYMIGNFISPISLRCLPTKWIMVVGSLFFTLYFGCFLFLNTYVLYACSALQGFMFSVFYAGYAQYVTEISTTKTLEKNVGLAWSLSCFSTFFGGCFYILITVVAAPDESTNSMYRNYSNTEILIFYMTFTVIAGISNILLASLPTRRVMDSIASTVSSSYENIFKNQQTSLFQTVTAELKLMVSTLVHPSILLLSPHFMYVGFNISFWLSIYPTSMQFTQSLSQFPLLTAFYGMTFSTGSMTAGLLMGPLSRRIHNFGQKPLLAFAVVLQTCLCPVLILSMPAASITVPTDERSLWIQPNIPLSLMFAFLFGVLDSANNMNRTVMCTLALPERRPQSFAVSRFYQALASSILLFITPRLSSQLCVGLLLANAYIGSLLYLKMIYNLERKAANEYEMKKIAPDLAIEIAFMDPMIIKPST